jgi:hypothetical protein
VHQKAIIILIWKAFLARLEHVLYKILIKYIIIYNNPCSCFVPLQGFVSIRHSAYSNELYKYKIESTLELLQTDDPDISNKSSSIKCTFSDNTPLKFA